MSEQEPLTSGLRKPSKKVAIGAAVALAVAFIVVIIIVVIVLVEKHKKALASASGGTGAPIVVTAPPGTPVAVVTPPTGTTPSTSTVVTPPTGTTPTTVTTTAPSPPSPPPPPPRQTAGAYVKDCGYSGIKGWFDVQNLGSPNDFCRLVGSAANPAFSCALAGGTSEYDVQVADAVSSARKSLPYVALAPGDVCYNLNGIIH
jgi:hypothetical protein